MFEAGDHIRKNCGVYDHHAIFVCWDDAALQRATLIHHRGKNDSSRIEQNPRQDVSQYTLATRPGEPLTVLRRARSRIGEGGYNLIFRNCEGFTSWCLSGGAGSSDQITRHTARVGYQIARLGGGAVEGAVEGAIVPSSSFPVSRSIGVALVAGELCYEAAKNIRAWYHGEISGARCAKGIIDSIGGVAGGLGGGLAGGALAGAVTGGPVGALVGGVFGGIVGQHAGSSLSGLLTSTIFDLPQSVVLENAYRFLGVARHAPNAEVSRVYRLMARELHPDRGGSHEQFIQLQSYLEVIRAARQG